MTRGKRPSREARKLALELLREGAAVYEVADRTGITPTTLYKWIETEGIPFQSPYLSRDGVCHIEDCQSPILAKSLCRMHYQRVFLHGSPDDPRPTVEERFWVKTAQSDDGHVLWTGSSARTGSGLVYGVFHALGETRAHRVAYRLFVGDIPEGYDIDHLCCVTLCVWYPHLEAVPPAENSRRIHERGRSYWQKTQVDPTRIQRNGKGQWMPGWNRELT